MDQQLPQSQPMGDVIDEIESLSQKLNSSSVPQDLREKSEMMVGRLRRMAKYGSYSSDFEIISRYIDWITRIPWSNKTNDQIDLTHAKEVMDKNHHGMESVKSLVLDYLAVMKMHLEGGRPLEQELNPNSEISMNSKIEGSSGHAPIICFVGLQGVGKTTMAKSIAQALGRKFIRISLGALGSVSQLRGQSRAMPDAEPGQIVKALVRTETMNPVILLDEIDKVSAKEGILMDAMAVLLEVLDPEQNSTFLDHYVDYPIDLSNVMFVCTANNLGTLSAALLDRLEVIRFTSYSDEEKVMIAKNFILPKVLVATGLKPGQLEIQENVWTQIVRPLGFDAGIRQLERNLTSLCRRAVRNVVEGKTNKVLITLENVKEYLPEGTGTLS
ncbi:MAG: AAA family ATPase [bacterium]